MIREPFATGDSVMHRLDPRVKVLSATAYSFLVALSYHFTTLWAALVFSLFLVASARYRPTAVLQRLVPVNGLILFFWAVVPVTFQGETLLTLGPLQITREGILLSARITLKSNAIILAVMALVASSPVAVLGHALGRLHVPEKMVHLLMMTYRYVFVIEQEYQRLLRSAKIRGFRPATGVHTYRTYAYFLGMLFVKAAGRAERVHQAMICRGFRGKFYCLCDFALTPLDWAWSMVLSGGMVGLLVLEWMNGSW
ncbi:MAG: cobalt ECF transporter T component CbiQ [Deltaproteobacteria bacterium]|nr:cobalt ECF transporter T component CbiQ [Deltaproteobacteria bacterium]MBW1923110.1 cobalt ECF transporter T component CbiQ [Deltaproteobacteria bacterium]MBW1949646.1 cobalt ECF transporter T component CbiQ [Deltaproteobacteria bacterium]MBW2009288.1 cobalt ECF transporter T component CbiQ [Deltaproteobacteria bacterium]MBW2346670.1 cobalt ECF transporter T component CbiQ [Deltaproteobacteria bacterium]